MDKSWVNADNTTTAPEGAEVVFTLYAGGEATDKTATLNAANGWTATFSNLPKYVTGTTTEIDYTVVETGTYPGLHRSRDGHVSWLHGKRQPGRGWRNDHEHAGEDRAHG